MKTTEYENFDALSCISLRYEDLREQFNKNYVLGD